MKHIILVVALLFVAAIACSTEVIPPDVTTMPETSTPTQVESEPTDIPQPTIIEVTQIGGDSTPTPTPCRPLGACITQTPINIPTATPAPTLTPTATLTPPLTPTPTPSPEATARIPTPTQIAGGTFEPYCGELVLSSLRLESGVTGLNARTDTEISSATYTGIIIRPENTIILTRFCQEGPKELWYGWNDGARWLWVIAVTEGGVRYAYADSL